MKQILVEVKPHSAKSNVGKITDLVYRVRLTAPPVEGKANDQLIKVLADYFKVSKSQISIKTGKTSKTKLVIISG